MRKGCLSFSKEMGGKIWRSREKDVTMQYGNLRSKVLNVRSEVWNGRSKVLNVRSKVWNENFIRYHGLI